jgi:lipid II:glycine glycyltransferase (peptidoglycan interpeptide bridge formation enzyme)
MSLTESRLSADWDDIVADQRDGTIYQTSMWAAAKGQRTERLVVVRTGESGCFRSGTQLLIRRLVPTVRAAYVPYGPLIADQADRGDEERRRILTRMEEEARTAGCSVIFVQPARNDHTTARLMETVGYRPAPIDVTTPASLEVTLGRPDDELFAALTKVRRRNVRRSERRGVKVELGDRSDLAVFHRLYSSSARRHGFLPMSFEYLERQWDALHPGGYLQLFLARVDGEILAAGTCLGYGRYAEFKLTGWDASEKAKTAFVNEGLNWAMMKWANERGFQIFDLGGLPRNQAERARVEGVDQTIRGTGSEFKLGWGGRLAVYPPAFVKGLGVLGRVGYGLTSPLLDDHGLGGRLVNWVRRS